MLILLKASRLFQGARAEGPMGHPTASRAQSVGDLAIFVWRQGRAISCRPKRTTWLSIWGELLLWRSQHASLASSPICKRAWDDQFCASTEGPPENRTTELYTLSQSSLCMYIYIYIFIYVFVYLYYMCIYDICAIIAGTHISDVCRFCQSVSGMFQRLVFGWLQSQVSALLPRIRSLRKCSEECFELPNNVRRQYNASIFFVFVFLPFSRGEYLFDNYDLLLCFVDRPYLSK